MKRVRAVIERRNLLQVRAEFISRAKKKLLRANPFPPPGESYPEIKIADHTAALDPNRIYLYMNYLSLSRGEQIGQSVGLYSQTSRESALTVGKSTLTVGGSALTERAETLARSITDPLAKLVVCEMDLHFTCSQLSLLGLMMDIESGLPNSHTPQERDRIQIMLMELKDLLDKINKDETEMLDKKIVVDKVGVLVPGTYQIILDYARLFQDYSNPNNVSLLECLLEEVSQHGNYAHLIDHVFVVLQHLLEPAYLTTPLAWGHELFRAQKGQYTIPAVKGLEGFHEKPIAFDEMEQEHDSVKDIYKSINRDFEKLLPEMRIWRMHNLDWIREDEYLDAQFILRTARSLSSLKREDLPDLKERIKSLLDGALDTND